MWFKVLFVSEFLNKNDFKYLVCYFLVIGYYSLIYIIIEIIEYVDKIE